MSQTLIEKIVQKHAVGLEANQKVKSGELISIQPAHVMTHDNTGAVMGKFKAIGAIKMSNPRQPVFTLDHNVQDTSKESTTGKVKPKLINDDEDAKNEPGFATELPIEMNAKLRYTLNQGKTPKEKQARPQTTQQEVGWRPNIEVVAYKL